MSSQVEFIGRPTPRQVFAEISIFRNYQNHFLTEHGHRVSGNVIEIGGELRYLHSQYFPNATSFTVSNIAREFDVKLDATDLPFRDDSQDAYVCASVLQHIPDPRQAIREMHRTLRPGGHLLLVAPFLYPVCDVADYGRWTPQGLEQLLADFEIRTVAHLGGRISSVVNLLQRPVHSRTRRYLVAKSFGAVIAVVMGRFDQPDDSPIGVGIHATKR